MLSKEGITLTIKEAPQGAWITHNGVNVGLAINPRLQMMYIHHNERSGQQSVHFWSYRLLVERLIAPMNIRYNALSVASVKAICALHDKLIRENISPIVQVVLRSQVRAGFRQYNVYNADVAATLPVEILKDIQQWKVAGAIFRSCLDFTHKWNDKSTNYAEKTQMPMQTWLESLSDTDKAYRALSSSVMRGKAVRWIGKVPENIQDIRQFHLEKPTASANIRLLLALNDLQLEKDEKDAWAKVIMHTNPSDIRYLFKLPVFRDRENYAEHEKDLLTYIRDGMRLEDSFDARRNQGYRHGRTGTISYSSMTSLLAMFNRSYRAHENERSYQEQRAEIDRANRMKSQKEWMQTETVNPPCKLPEFDEKSEGRVRFLAHVFEIHDEGTLMKHCVASYDRSAAAGDCYLFHVDYKGQLATIELRPNGSINQAKGPHNVQNAATKWGSDFIRAWVARWPELIAKEAKELAEATLATTVSGESSESVHAKS